MIAAIAIAAFRAPEPLRVLRGAAARAVARSLSSCRLSSWR